MLYDPTFIPDNDFVVNCSQKTAFQIEQPTFLEASTVTNLASAGELSLETCFLTRASVVNLFSEVEPQVISS
jgi:hypothetical protein